MIRRFSHPRVSVFTGRRPDGRATLPGQLYRLALLALTTVVMAASLPQASLAVAGTPQLGAGHGPAVSAQR
jgi:hypothetical protein